MSSDDDINFVNRMFDIVFNDNADMQDLQNHLSTNINGNLINNLFNNSFNSSDEFNNMNDNFSFNYNPFNIFNYMFYDPIEEVLQESLNMQPDSLEKTDHIIKISSTRYETLDEKIKEENKTCSICILEFENEDKISITNCNHIFHTDCITEWGKYKTECPICREKLE